MKSHSGGATDGSLSARLTTAVSGGAAGTEHQDAAIARRSAALAERVRLGLAAQDILPARRPWERDHPPAPGAAMAPADATGRAAVVEGPGSGTARLPLLLLTDALPGKSGPVVRKLTVRWRKHKARTPG